MPEIDRVMPDIELVRELSPRLEVLYDVSSIRTVPVWMSLTNTDGTKPDADVLAGPFLGRRYVTVQVPPSILLDKSPRIV